MVLRRMWALPLAFAVACSPGALADASQAAPAPHLATGDTWVYNRLNAFNGEFVATYRHRVAAVQDQTVSVEITRQGDGPAIQQAYTTDWRWLAASLTNLQPFAFKPALPAFAFPLEIGKSWQQDVIATDPATGRHFNVKVYGWVLGIERVKVPAGDFDAFKIRRSIYAGDFDFWKTQTRILEHDWYAPAVNGVIKHEDASEYNLTSSRGAPLIKGDRSRWELVSYTPGAGNTAGVAVHSRDGGQP